MFKLQAHTNFSLHTKCCMSRPTECSIHLNPFLCTHFFFFLILVDFLCGLYLCVVSELKFTEFEKLVNEIFCVHSKTNRKRTAEKEIWKECLGIVLFLFCFVLRAYIVITTIIILCYCSQLWRRWEWDSKMVADEGSSNGNARLFCNHQKPGNEKEMMSHSDGLSLKHNKRIKWIKLWKNHYEILDFVCYCHFAAILLAFYTHLMIIMK